MQTFIQGFRELPFKNYIWGFGGASILVIPIIIALLGVLPPEVPLFYGKPVGEGQLTSTLGLTIAPISALLILSINCLIATLTPSIFVKKVLVIGGFVSCLLAIVTVLKIIFLVGFF